jgi:hypothetical protein
MTRDEADALIADLMAEHFDRLRGELETRIAREIAAKPLPAFVPPPVWVEGKRFAGGSTVRWRNGLFFAQRDSEGEPGVDDAWLPLVVGLAGFDMRWLDDRTFACDAVLSDGRIIETRRDFAVPIVRGYWNAETTYLPGDRVFRYGEWHATAMSLGIDPTTDAEQHWEKVGGKYARAALALALDDEGTLTESGRAIGTFKPLIEAVLDRLLAKHAAAA